MPVKLGATLRELMDGHQYCDVEDLTKNILIQTLTHLGEIKEVEIIPVEVQTLAGSSFTVSLDSDENQVSALKAKIQNQEGTSIHRQELLMLKYGKTEFTDSESAESATVSLADSAQISQSCSVMLCVKIESGLHGSP